MATTRTGSACHRTAIALAAVLLLAGAARAQPTCDWYAKTALKQQRENEHRKCGLKGPEWSSDFKAHLAWCATVAPDVWKKSAQKRDQELAACLARTK